MVLRFLCMNFPDYEWAGFLADGADFRGDTLRYRMKILGVVRICLLQPGRWQQDLEEGLRRCRVPRQDGCAMQKNLMKIQSHEIQEELLVHMRNILHWDAEAGKI